MQTTYKIILFIIAILIFSCNRQQIKKIPEDVHYSTLEFNYLVLNLDKYLGVNILTEGLILRSPSGSVSLMTSENNSGKNSFSIQCFINDETDYKAMIWLLNSDGYNKSKVRVKGRIISRSLNNYGQPLNGLLIHEVAFSGEDEISNFTKNLISPIEVSIDEILERSIENENEIISFVSYVQRDKQTLLVWDKNQNQPLGNVNILPYIEDDEIYNELLNSDHFPFLAKIAGLISYDSPNEITIRLFAFKKL